MPLMTRQLILAAVGAHLWACSVTSSPSTIIDRTADSEQAGDSRRGDSNQVGDTGSTGDIGGNGGDTHATNVEVCNGYDDDHDSLVDEGLDGAPCSEGGTGITRCIRGHSVCTHCIPGELRESPCGCDETRTDRCSDLGNWQDGVCDGCDEDVQENPCRQAEACKPDEEIYRRCDFCTDETCGSNCMASRWRCTETCEWTMIEDCTARQPECSSDDVKVQNCALCGKKRLSCDGCFWQYDPCLDTGMCVPGEMMPVPCFAEDCSAGLSAFMTCGEDCQWETSECAGCVVGDTTYETAACLDGYDCGTIVIEHYCEAQASAPTCGGTGAVATGAWQEREYSRSCSIDCTPGRYTYEDCALGGCGGSQRYYCNNQCDWELSGGCEENFSCTPGTQRTTTYSCGNNWCGNTSVTYTYTCASDGCGETVVIDGQCSVCEPSTSQTSFCSSSPGACTLHSSTCTDACAWGSYTTCTPSTDICGDCPQCSSGAEDNQACTTANGMCGTQTRTCGAGCLWSNWTSCEAGPSSCTTGAHEYRECARYCNEAWTAEWTCNGCGWEQTGECLPPTGACIPGTYEPQGGSLCNPLIPSCGYKNRYCDTNTCRWVEEACFGDCEG